MIWWRQPRSGRMKVSIINFWQGLWKVFRPISIPIHLPRLYLYHNQTSLITCSLRLFVSLFWNKMDLQYIFRYILVVRNKPETKTRLIWSAGPALWANNWLAPAHRKSMACLNNKWQRALIWSWTRQLSETETQLFQPLISIQEILNLIHRAYEYLLDKSLWVYYQILSRISYSRKDEESSKLEFQHKSWRLARVFPFQQHIQQHVNIYYSVSISFVELLLKKSYQQNLQETVIKFKTTIQYCIKNWFFKIKYQI